MRDNSSVLEIVVKSENDDTELELEAEEFEVGKDSESVAEPIYIGNSQQMIGPTVIPFGYQAWNDGLFIINESGAKCPVPPSVDKTVSTSWRLSLKPLADKPIWITRFGRDVETGIELVELSTKGLEKNEVIAAWVERRELADSRTVIALAKLGFMVHSQNAATLVTYFSKLMKENGQRLPWVSVTRKVGAVKTPQGVGWLLGKHWVGPGDTDVVSDPRDGEHEGLGPSGSAEAWWEKWDEVTDQDTVTRWLCYTSFASPLLRLIRRRTFLVHHWASSGSGKSALAKFAMTVWGDPAKLTEHFNRTEKSFTELFNTMTDLPVVFDELQASSLEDHSSIIYTICLEKGRARAKATGGLEKAIGDWRAVVRTNGEEPLIGKGKLNLGGQTNRVIQLHGSEFTRFQAASLHQWMDDGHWGHAGLEFLHFLRDHILSRPDGQERLVGLYKQFRRAIDADPRFGPLQDRTAHLAVVALAQYLVLTSHYGTPNDLAAARALKDARAVAEVLLEDQKQNLPVHEQALQILRDHRDSQGALWLDLSREADAQALESGRQNRLFGIVVPELSEVWLLQGEANKLLHREGLPPAAVWAAFAELGILKLSDTRSNAVVRKRGKKFRNRVYVLDLEALDHNQSQLE